MVNIYASLFTMSILLSCTYSQVNESKNQEGKTLDIEVLHNYMTGAFSSAQQAAEDSSFFDISLVMFPIWTDDKEFNWLYVEQAVTKFREKPYRQRVYQLIPSAVGIIESKVFELPDPAKFIHAWDDPSLFNELQKDSLILRDGCSVFLQKPEDGCFTGSTKDKECLSSLRGSVYATSQVQICVDKIISWDQGWNAKDEQVWGAEKGGYIFIKTD
ncbi:MAG: hypothetical protein HKN92_07585 [Chitinophagales bacterium]|nr:hypothetical protein [Chitinophagales bacterium]